MGTCQATSAVLCAVLSAARSFPALVAMHLHVRVDDYESTASEPLVAGAPSIASTFSSTIEELTCIETLSLSGFIREEGMVASIAAVLPRVRMLQVFEGTEVRFGYLEIALFTTE